MTAEPDHPRTWLKTWLLVIFLIAMFMGPGPGMRLVNPSHAGDPLTIGTVPILYAWALFWFAVQATVVLVAYVTIWSRDTD